MTDDRVELVAELRKAGFTTAALDYPRSDFALRLLCAFNGVDLSHAPAGWRYFPNAETQAAWERVADAAAEYIRTLDPSIESLQAEVRRWETDCAFLLSVIDSCDEAEAPSCEMEPEDVSNIARIRQALAAKE